MGVEPVTLDVAPHLDLFVPFEVPLLDLGPGWYRLELEGVIDGVADVVHPGERFAMAWPRGSMRRGSVSVRKIAEAGSTSVTIEQVECTPDSVRVTYAAPARVGDHDRRRRHDLSPIEEDFDPEAGRGRVVVYPWPRRRRACPFPCAGSRRRWRSTCPELRCRTVGGIVRADAGTRARRGVPAALCGVRRRHMAVLRAVPSVAPCPDAPLVRPLWRPVE